MAEEIAPARGSARRARTDARIATAVHEQLRHGGYASLTIEGVAAASGVAKTTIYRRWASKAEMVYSVVIHTDEGSSAIDTGTLAGDVRRLAERAVALVAEEPGRSVLPGLLADMTGDAELAGRLRESFIAAARGEIVAMLDRARLRGELTETVPVAEFHAALLGIPYAHVHLLADAETDRLVGSLSRQLLALLHP
ncbi:TetR/AcrR family transcriptional regulator [Leucobacter sp. CSA2]|uniref:TetR/AcrR family transcriptional regulator n=1 Tax=Leucobacter edaphi TaxID=2796472 RepID=A0A934QAH1_9MICO|nr:TetR/AcrR family transcriptional regulator [Leucobacter edaphi]MBK0420523.1 TetR/AcrR family transcriptional regulator [Leucobacter edaphi]